MMRASDLLPPVATRLLRRLRRDRIRWTGDHADWAAARAVSGDGYQDPTILARSAAAAARVLAGEAAFERDGHVFMEPETRTSLLAALLLLHARTGSLRVLDWGGGLASTWLQHRGLLASVSGISWTVLELPAVAAAGSRLFGVAGPVFISDPSQAGPSDAVLFSGSLQYFEDPDLVLEQAAALAPAVVIDRLPLHAGSRERIAVQRVPDAFGRASYPCRLMTTASLRERTRRVRLAEVMVWTCDERADDERLRFCGGLWERAG